LSCDQDREIIGFAYEAASDVAEETMRNAISRAKELYEEYQKGGGRGN